MAKRHSCNGKDRLFQIRMHQNKCVCKQAHDKDDRLKSDSNTRDHLKGQYPFQQMYELLKLNWTHRINSIERGPVCHHGVLLWGETCRCYLEGRTGRLHLTGLEHDFCQFTSSGDKGSPDFRKINIKNITEFVWRLRIKHLFVLIKGLFTY